MTNNTNQGPVEGGLPSLSLPLPPRYMMRRKQSRYTFPTLSMDDLDGNP